MDKNQQLGEWRGATCAHVHAQPGLELPEFLSRLRLQMVLGYFTTTMFLGTESGNFISSSSGS